MRLAMFVLGCLVCVVAGVLSLLVDVDEIADTEREAENFKFFGKVLSGLLFFFALCFGLIAIVLTTLS